MAKTTAKTRHPLAQAPLDELAAELARRRPVCPSFCSAEIDCGPNLNSSTHRSRCWRGWTVRPDTLLPAAERRRRGRRRVPLAIHRCPAGSRGGPTLREKIGEVLAPIPCDRWRSPAPWSTAASTKAASRSTSRCPHPGEVRRLRQGRPRAVGPFRRREVSRRDGSRTRSPQRRVQRRRKK